MFYLTKAQKTQNKATRGQIYLHIAMIVTIVIMLLPLVMTFYNSFKSLNEYDHEMWFPSLPLHLYNYSEAWDKLKDYVINTLLVTVIGVIGMLLISSLAAYAIGKIRFKGSGFVYFLVLALMMLPGVLTLVPSTMIYRTLHLENTIFALVFPIWSNGCLMTVFLFTSFFKGLPKEIFEAAKIDGAGEFKQYFKIAVPLSGPTICTCTIIQVVSIWNDYLWPKTIQTETGMYTLPAGILYQYQNYNNTPEMFAGYILAAIPLLILFIFANKYYIEGLTGSAIKM